jgi:hypothetical protein
MVQFDLDRWKFARFGREPAMKRFGAQLVYALLIHGWAQWVVTEWKAGHAGPRMFDLMFHGDSVDKRACEGGL